MESESNSSNKRIIGSRYGHIQKGKGTIIFLVSCELDAGMLTIKVFLEFKYVGLFFKPKGGVIYIVFVKDRFKITWAIK